MSGGGVGCTDTCEIASQAVVCNNLCQTCQTSQSADNVDISGPLFNAVANAIRYRTNTTASIPANDFPEAIKAMPHAYVSDGVTYTTLASLFTAMADAIRFKAGSSSSIVASTFPSAIMGIPTTISFSMNDMVMSESYFTYAVTLGMTWQLYFSNSSYVTVSGSTVTGTFSPEGKTTYYYDLYKGSSAVSPSDQIINGATYTWTLNNIIT